MDGFRLTQFIYLLGLLLLLAPAFLYAFRRGKREAVRNVAVWVGILFALLVAHEMFAHEPFMGEAPEPVFYGGDDYPL